MQLDDQTKLAIASFGDLTRQVLTLSTAIVAFDIAYFNNRVAGAPAIGWVLIWSWGFFLLSIAGGVGAMMSLTGGLARARQEAGQPPPIDPGWIYSAKIQRFSVLQFVGFGLGLLLNFGYAAFAR